MTTPEPDGPDPAAATELSAAGPLSLAEAADLLDWLEGQGIEPEWVDLGPDGRVEVLWRARPAAARLSPSVAPRPGG